MRWTRCKQPSRISTRALLHKPPLCGYASPLLFCLVLYPFFPPPSLLLLFHLRSINSLAQLVDEVFSDAILEGVQNAPVIRLAFPHTIAAQRNAIAAAQAEGEEDLEDYLEYTAQISKPLTEKKLLEAILTALHKFPATQKRKSEPAISSSPWSLPSATRSGSVALPSPTMTSSSSPRTAANLSTIEEENPPQSSSPSTQCAATPPQEGKENHTSAFHRSISNNPLRSTSDSLPSPTHPRVASTNKRMDSPTPQFQFRRRTHSNSTSGANTGPQLVPVASSNPNSPRKESPEIKPEERSRNHRRASQPEVVSRPPAQGTHDEEESPFEPIATRPRGRSSPPPFTTPQHPSQSTQTPDTPSPTPNSTPPGDPTPNGTPTPAQDHPRSATPTRMPTPTHATDTTPTPPRTSTPTKPTSTANGSSERIDLTEVPPSPLGPLPISPPPQTLSQVISAIASQSSENSHSPRKAQARRSSLPHVYKPMSERNVSEPNTPVSSASPPTLVSLMAPSIAPAMASAHSHPPNTSDSINSTNFTSPLPTPVSAASDRPALETSPAMTPRKPDIEVDIPPTPTNGYGNLTFTSPLGDIPSDKLLNQTDGEQSTRPRRALSRQNSLGFIHEDHLGDFGADQILPEKCKVLVVEVFFFNALLYEDFINAFPG
jgi:hypothetical protein